MFKTMQDVVETAGAGKAMLFCGAPVAYAHGCLRYINDGAVVPLSGASLNPANWSIAEPEPEPVPEGPPDEPSVYGLKLIRPDGWNAHYHAHRVQYLLDGRWTHVDGLGSFVTVRGGDGANNGLCAGGDGEGCKVVMVEAREPSGYHDVPTGVQCFSWVRICPEIERWRLDLSLRLWVRDYGDHLTDEQRQEILGEPEPETVDYELEWQEHPLDKRTGLHPFCPELGRYVLPAPFWTRFVEFVFTLPNGMEVTDKRCPILWWRGGSLRERCVPGFLQVRATHIRLLTSEPEVARADLSVNEGVSTDVERGENDATS